jgi:hypothetical protein
MTDRDWERELAEIDRRLASTPDPAPDPPVAARRAAPAQLPPAARTASPPVPSASTAGGVGSSGSDVSARAAGRSVGTPAAPGRRSWRAQVALLFRLALGAAVVAALVYWPYPAACGAGLAVYLGLVAALGLAGSARPRRPGGTARRSCTCSASP